MPPEVHADQKASEPQQVGVRSLSNSMRDCCKVQCEHSDECKSHLEQLYVACEVRSMSHLPVISLLGPGLIGKRKPCYADQSTHACLSGRDFNEQRDYLASEKADAVGRCRFLVARHGVARDKSDKIRPMGCPRHHSINAFDIAWNLSPGKEEAQNRGQEVVGLAIDGGRVAARRSLHASWSEFLRGWFCRSRRRFRFCRCSFAVFLTAIRFYYGDLRRQLGSSSRRVGRRRAHMGGGALSQTQLKVPGSW